MFGMIGPAALLVAAGGAMAQTGAPEPGPEPTLSAEQQSPPAPDTLSSLWWADGQTRDQQGLETLADGLRRAPGLIASAAPGNGTMLLAVQHGRARPGVSVNGILLPGPLPIDLALPDMQALLAAPPSGLDAGPAGAAGVAALTLRRPAARLSGAGEVAAGGFGSRRALGRLDLPLAGGARLGIGGVLHHDLGWLQNNRTGERLNRGQRGGLLASLDLDPAADLAVRLDAFYQRSAAGNLPSFACDPIAPTRCGGRFASTGRRSSDRGAQADPGWGPISADLAGQALGQRADLTLVAAELAWTPPRAFLRLSAGLTRQIDRLGLDLRDGRRTGTISQPTGLASGGYGLIAHGTSAGRQVDLSAGFERGALTVTLAAGLRSEDLARDQADTDAGIVLADRAIGQTRDVRHAAAAAHLALAGDRLTLDAGVRWTDERLDLTVQDRRAGCAPCLRVAGADRQQQRFWTPELALGWQQGDALIFARSVRTARLPGWNLLARSTAELAALPAETGWHHEAGIRIGREDRLQLTASGFAARTKALASPLLGIDPLAMAVGVAMAGGQRQDLTNAGIDVSAQARPLRQLDVSATLTVQRARWRETVSGTVPAGVPSRPLFTPDVTASLSAAWTQVLIGAGANLVPRLTLDHRSAMAVAAGSVPGAPGGFAPAGWQVAGALQLDIPGGGWLVSLECRNCLDRTLVDGAVAGLATLNPPRWWQVRLLRRF
jgi:iron complex outermembrane recepter protein